MQPCQAVLLAEDREQAAGGEAARADQPGVALQQHGGILVGDLAQIIRARHIGQTIAGLAGLPRAESLAAAAQAEILVGDEEAVLGVAQQGQAPPGDRG